MSRLFEFIDDHDRDCEYRRAAVMGINYECEHGHDVCPICDPCTCARPEAITRLLARAIGTRDWPDGSGAAGRAALRH